MEMRAGARGTQSRSTGRKPGWFARRPAMTILSAPLRLGVSRSLWPLANRLAGWSHSLASRWLPRHPAEKAWQGPLDYSAPPRRATADRRAVSRSPGVTGGKLFIQRRLQTLSLPEGLRIEEPAPQSWTEEDLSIEAGQPDKPLVAPADEKLPQSDVQPISFTSPATSDAEIPPDNFQALSPHSRARLARPALSGATGLATNRITSPQWPFRLVSPLSEQKASAGRTFSSGAAAFRKQRISQPLVNAASGALPSSLPAVLASRRTTRVDREIIQPRLIATPMAHEQPGITTTRPFIATLLPKPGMLPLIMFERNRQSQSREFHVEPTQGFPAGQPASQYEPLAPAAPILQRRTLPGRVNRFPHTLVGSSTYGAQPTPPGSSQPLAAVPEQSILPTSPEPTAQVRPPDAMLTLLPSRQPETELTGDRAESQSFQGMLEQEWPLLSVLHRLETQPEKPTDSAAVQVLRRMWPKQALLVRQTLQALAAGGPGERLPSPVMLAMQARLGRDLSQVRLHTSPLVQTLRAEAFTSGRNVVFAPGRLDMNTGKGLALLGHELTHIGQPLAFKQESSAGQVFEDSHERVARQQEVSIQRIIENGWPKTHSMELQRPGRPATPAAPAITATSPFIQRLADENTASVESIDTGSASPTPSQAAESSGQLAGASPPGGQAGSSTSTAPGGSPTGTPAPNANVDALARQVYGILKNRLRAERDRRELYNF
jgi:hypothetical protein